MESRKLNLSPLQMMQKFYQDYGKSKHYASLESESCKYARKKSSNTDKMTKFLSDYEKRSRGSSTITYNDAKSSMHNAATMTPSRYKSNISEVANRCYFKNNYSESHPFLMTNHKIGQKDIEQIKSGLKTEPIEYNYENLYQNNRLMNPVQSRKSMQEMKDTIVRMKYNRKDRMEKIRYNYIVNKCYKNHRKEDGGNFGSRLRISELNTQERIFPSANLKL